MEPCFDLLGPSFRQLESGGPLFSVSICKLPENHACLLIQLSHIIGDGSTYYKILGQMQEIMDGKNLENIQKLDWSVPSKNPMFPDFFTEKDIFLESQSWVPEFMRRLSSEPRRKSQIELIDKDHIEVLKQKYLDDKVEFLSTNDILTSALAEVFGTKLMNMATDMRGRMDGISKNFAGIAVRPIFFPRKQAVLAPKFIRGKIMKDFCFWSNSEEIAQFEKSFLACGLSSITNWSSLTKFVKPPGTKILAHCPNSGFVEDLSFDVCIVFKATPNGDMALNHNMKINDEDVQNRIEKSAIFKQILQQK